MSEDFAPASGSTNVSEPGGLSQLERLLDAFVAPSKTFADILRNASWWLPFILMVLSGLSLAYVVQKQVGYERVSENAVHQSPKQEERLASATPEQRATQMHIMTLSNQGSAYAAPILILIFFAIYSLILWASFNFGLGSATRYSQVFAVVFYASLPFLFINIIAIMMLYFGANADAYDIKNPAGTNLGYYLTDTSPWLHALLTQLDIMRLWSVALTVLGMAIISKKTIMQSAVIVLGLWVVGLLLNVGLTAAFA